MGTYAYALRSPKLARRVTVTLANGSEETVDVASVGYAYKPSWSLGAPKWVAPFLARMQGLWGDRRPAFAALTERLDKKLDLLPPSKRFRLEVGQTVYRWASGRVPFAMDDAGGEVGNGERFGVISRVHGPIGAPAA